jgi:hypothetical protein
MKNYLGLSIKALILVTKYIQYPVVGRLRALGTFNVKRKIFLSEKAGNGVQVLPFGAAQLSKWTACSKEVIK